MIFRIISITATVFTCIVFLSPYSTYANLSPPATAPILPLCSILVQSLFWFTYGLYIMDIVVIAVNLFGVCCGILYTFFYARSKPAAMFYVKVAGSVFVFIGVVVFIFYNFGDYATKRAYLGYSSMVMSIILFASPLSTIFQVIKKKDSSSLPLTLTLANLAATASWSLYGLLGGDWNIFVPNFIGVLLSLLTLWMRKKYKSSGPIFEF